jgi:hypothetical protein
MAIKRMDNVGIVVENLDGARCSAPRTDSF